MKHMTIQEAKTAMLKSGKNWRIPFMEFVDDLRRTQDQTLMTLIIQEYIAAMQSAMGIIGANSKAKQLTESKWSD